jgi:hypothetical protein
MQSRQLQTADSDRRRIWDMGSKAPASPVAGGSARPPARGARGHYPGDPGTAPAPGPRLEPRHALPSAVGRGAHERDRAT